MFDNEVLVGVGAAVIGTAQAFVIREFVDKRSLAPIIPQLGKYGSASCVAGIGLGGVATAAGLASLLYGKGIRDERTARALVAYGVPALVTGALSGYLTPTVRRVVSAAEGAPQAYFSPQANMGGVEANYANLSQMEKINLGVL